MEQHAKTFNRLIGMNTFYSNGLIQIKELKPQQYFQEIVEKATLITSPLVSQEIEKYSSKSDSGYDKHLEEFLNSANGRALPLPAQITGIEDLESVVYVENHLFSNFFLTSYQNTDPQITGCDGLLFAGNMELMGNISNGSLPFLIDPIFYGVMSDGLFVELGKENEEMMLLNLKNSAMAYIEQLALFQAQDKGDEVISVN